MYVFSFLELNHSTILKVATFLFLLKAPLKLRKFSLQSIEDGLRDPGTGNLNEIFTKLLVDPSIIAKALITGEGYEYKWWGDQLRKLVLSWYSSLQIRTEQLENLRNAVDFEVREDDLLASEMAVREAKSFIQDIGEENPFTEEEATFCTIPLQKRLGMNFLC